MAYALLADMTTRYGAAELVQLTDRADPPSGEIDEDIVDAALADASAEIDSHLVMVYTLPLASVPPVLVLHTCALARERLHTQGVPDDVAAAAQRARDWLKAVVERLTAPVDPGDPGGGGDAIVGAGRWAGPERVFTAELFGRR